MMLNCGLFTVRTSFRTKWMAMRIYIFKSDANSELRAFSDDASGVKLPDRFRPWHAIGAIAADDEPPHRFSRAVIEKAIRDSGYQLWRMGPKTEMRNTTCKYLFAITMSTKLSKR